MPAAGGVCLFPGGVCLVQGVPALAGGGAWWRPPGMATAVGGMHPTGMHSCSTKILPKKRSSFSEFGASPSGKSCIYHSIRSFCRATDSHVYMCE